MEIAFKSQTKLDKVELEEIEREMYNLIINNRQLMKNVNISTKCYI